MRIHEWLLLSALCTGSVQSQSSDWVRRAILESRVMGAHGEGYNMDSLNQLSRRLIPADIPAIIGLLPDKELRMGAIFALASQCDAAIAPTRDAAVSKQLSFLEAQDVLGTIQHFPACNFTTREKAAALLAELKSLEEAGRLHQSQLSADDARINENGLKLLDPKLAKTLTRQEREEVYHRSLKAMGIKEDGPMSPAVRSLVDKMYRTMVLGEHSKPRPN